MITITNARIGDIPEIAGIERECFSVPWSEEILERQAIGEREIFLVAREDDRVLGYMGLTYVLDEGHISNVAVARAARRRGIGSALVSDMCCRCEKMGVAYMMLEVRSSNLPAIRLYKSHGFEPVGRRRDYYDEPPEDAILMTLFLKPDDEGGSAAERT